MKNNGAVTARVLGFARSRIGLIFFMGELLTYVRIVFPKTAPETPGRLLRKLQATGAVQYTLVSRARSTYQIERAD